MLQNFSSKEILEQMSEIEILQEELKNLKEERERIRSLCSKKDGKIWDIENHLSTFLIEKQKVSIFSKIASLFNIGKFYNINKQMKEQEEQLKLLKEEYQQLKQKESELFEREFSLSDRVEERKLASFLKENEGILTITEKNDDYLKRDKTTTKGLKEIDLERRVLVHCTNFFPKDKVILSDFDGGKIASSIQEYHGVRKEVSAWWHRHEVHATINSRVENTSDGQGNWDNPNYIILERFDKHEDEMEDFCPSDAWTNGTSIKLSEDAIIMVRFEDRDKLPISREDFDKYNIVYYEGDPTKCLRNFLVFNDYEILATNANAPNHAASPRSKNENALNYRDYAINFIRNNTYLSKEISIFSDVEIAQIMDIVCNMNGAWDNFNFLGSELMNVLIKDKNLSKKQKDDYRCIADFIVCSGLKKAGDRKYTFGQDEETIEDLKDKHKKIEDIIKIHLASVDTRIDKIPDWIDAELIDEIFAIQQIVAEKYSSIEHSQVEEFSDMSLEELYKFENQIKCEAVMKNFPEDITIESRNDDVVIAIHVDGEIGKLMEKNYGMKFVSAAPLGEIKLSLAKSAKISDIRRTIDEFRKKEEETKQRKSEVRNVGENDDYGNR